MQKLKNRLKRVEAAIEETKFTDEDVELILSALPPDYAADVRSKLSANCDRRIANGEIYQPAGPHGPAQERSGLFWLRLETILSALTPEDAANVRAKFI
jgi:hypothetical protein